MAKWKLPSSKKGKAVLAGISIIVLGFILMGYSYEALVIARGELAPGKTPDLNHDGVANVLDAQILGNHMGQTVNSTNSFCDLNGDGVIDSADANILTAYMTTPTLDIWGPLTSLSTGWGQGFWAGAVLSVVGLGVIFIFARKKHR